MGIAFAQSNGSGYIGDNYYRIHNFGSGRYIYVTDNKDNYDIVRDKEDFQALQLWKDENKTVSEPATVIYMEKQNNGQFDLKGQGTGVNVLTTYYVNVKKNNDGTYEVFASKDGVTKYLSDNEQSNSDKGRMGTSGILKYKKWVVDKIDKDHATNYFGIKPTVELNGKYYHAFFADFPFRAVSPDMHIYYISQTEGELALLQEIEGDVPARTPVIIECASANTTDNRIEILSTKPASVTGNKLKGVYFCNGSRPKTSTDAYKKFDAGTMRILSAVNGKLVLTDNAPEHLVEMKVNDYTTYTQVTVKCIPANTCYFEANANTPSVIELTSDPTSIGNISASNKEQQAAGVYSLSGTLLRQTNDTQGLPAGLYIVGGKKVVVK